MGKYTIYDDKWVDMQIQSQLDIIVSKIIEIIPNVRSILISGGFGRGEGSVIIDKDSKKVIPLKDYDLVVVVDKKPSANVIKHLNDVIYQTLGLQNPETEIFKFSNFVIDIAFTTKENLQRFPDIVTYELKVASYLLYGEDIRKEIPWTINDVHPYSGLRLLFEKMTGLIGHFSQEYLLNTNVDKHKRISLIYECYKTYVEIATALCILMKCYKPSYRERMKLFEINFQKHFPELASQIPNLPNLVTKATLFKLKPDFNSLREDPVGLWLTTRDILITVLKYYLESLLNIKIRDWTNEYKQLLSILSQKYFRILMKTVLYRKFKIRWDGLVSIALKTWQVYQNIEYISMISKHNKNLYLRPILRPYSPILKIFLVSPLVLNALNGDGSHNTNYFKKAIEDMKYILPVPNRIASWDELRYLYLTAYKIYGGPK